MQKDSFQNCLIKTEHRNKMGVKTARAFLHIKEGVKEQEACFEFLPTEAMLSL